MEPENSSRGKSDKDKNHAEIRPLASSRRPAALTEIVTLVFHRKAITILFASQELLHGTSGFVVKRAAMTTRPLGLRGILIFSHLLPLLLLVRHL